MFFCFFVSFFWPGQERIGPQPPWLNGRKRRLLLGLFLFFLLLSYLSPGQERIGPQPPWPTCRKRRLLLGLGFFGLLLSYFSSGQERIGPQLAWLIVRGDFYWVCFFCFVLFLAFWSFQLYPMLSKSSLKFGPRFGGVFLPVGRPRASDVPPLPTCLESQGCHLIPSFYLLSRYSA